MKIIFMQVGESMENEETLSNNVRSFVCSEDLYKFMNFFKYVIES